MIVSSVAGGFILVGTETTCANLGESCSIGSRFNRLESAARMKSTFGPYLAYRNSRLSAIWSNKRFFGVAFGPA